MIEKIDVGRAACKAFIFDEIVFEEGLDRISLLNDQQLKERTSTSGTRDLVLFSTYFHVAIAFVAQVTEQRPNVLRYRIVQVDNTTLRERVKVSL